MAINVAGLLVLGVLIVVLSLMSWASIVSSTAVGLTSAEAVNRDGERARTGLTLVSAEGGGTTLTLQLKNTGLTSVYDYAAMDFIVDYTDAAVNTVATYLAYTTGTLGANQWKMTSISPDSFQPNAWNPGETITLDALLSPAQSDDTIGNVIVATPNGVLDTSPFSARGFFWFTNAQDISLTTTGSWQDIDLSSYVPVGTTTGAIVELVNTGTTGNLSGVVRGKKDTRDYMSDTLFQAMAGETHRWQIVEVDGNRLIQGYIEDTAIDFKLRGYTLGADPSYFNTPFDITPPVSQEGLWATVDVSAYVGGAADGVILFIDSTKNGDVKYGIRETGSSFPEPQSDLRKYSNTMYLVGINAADQFQAWIGDVATVKVYLVGQTKDSVVYYIEDVAVADPALDSWQELDADTYSVPTEANGLIFRAGTTGGKARKAGFRHGDSTDDWNGDIERRSHLQGGTGIRADNVWDEYLEHAQVDVFIAAYTKALTN
ncbi:MAG: hypothetical protein IIB29_03125 [Chloroflexi bacterium]|nr:hypothetical protein [Chloroflexota bacterium]